MKKIVYFGHGWAENVGNAFVDMGINYQLNTLPIEKSIYNISNTSMYFKKRTAQFPFSKYLFTFSNFDVRMLLTDVDYVIFGGALLNKNWLATNMQLIELLSANHTKIVILGGGGGNLYSHEQSEFVLNVLKKIKLHAMITRDEYTYEKYGSYAEYSYNGIDNALFLNDCFNPFAIDMEYCIYAFDHMEIPQNLPTLGRVLTLNHSYTSVSRFDLFLKRPLKVIRRAISTDMISDYPDDYLHLYANSKLTLSDRVHACIATIVFGGKAQYFASSHRSYLFDRLKLSEIRNKPLKLDFEYIDDEKSRQLQFLKEVIQ